MIVRLHCNSRPYGCCIKQEKIRWTATAGCWKLYYYTDLLLCISNMMYREFCAIQFVITSIQCVITFLLLTSRTLVRCNVARPRMRKIEEQQASISLEKRFKEPSV